MTFLQVPNDSPEFGAAYRYFFDYIQPFRCKTREQEEAVRAEVDRTIKWAQETQAPEVWEAYVWAGQTVKDHIASQLAIQEFGDKVEERAKTFPIPPPPTVEAVETQETERPS